MSFSGNTKEELSHLQSKARHCQIAELAGIMCNLGKLYRLNDTIGVKIETENVLLARRSYELIKRVFRFSPRVQIRRNSFLNRNRIYSVVIEKADEAETVLMALKIPFKETDFGKKTEWVVNEMLLQKSCCKRAYIRGVFFSAGSITDPEKGYHFECVFNDQAKANQYISQMAFFGIEGKSIERKGHFVVYIKEGAQIVDVLNVMEAHNALMELENVRILKEVRNSVNRKVNCETANINKTVSAAVKQIEDIVYIRDHVGLESLSPALFQVAERRLAYPEAPLKELGEMLNPPVGKSGVNHRLRKLSQIAEELRS